MTIKTTMQLIDQLHLVPFTSNKKIQGIYFFWVSKCNVEKNDT